LFTAYNKSILKPKNNMAKYTWALRRFWLHWLKSDILRWYYKSRYGWNMSTNGTMLPTTGKGPYVSVYVKGNIIQIVDENLPVPQNEIRIIPCKENHGVMVEMLKNGKVSCRHLLDIEQLNKEIIFASNVEQLTNR